jgi:hypothetical protein
MLIFKTYVLYTFSFFICRVFLSWLCTLATRFRSAYFGITHFNDLLLSLVFLARSYYNLLSIPLFLSLHPQEAIPEPPETKEGREFDTMIFYISLSFWGNTFFYIQGKRPIFSLYLLLLSSESLLLRS